MSVDDVARRLGAMLRCADLEDAFEYRFMFDLTANTFLQKLIPKRLMDRKLGLTPGEYFRSLLVLSYAASALGDKLLDNVAVLGAELAKINRKATLPLGLLAVEIGLFAAEHKPPGGRAAAAKKCACDASKIDPYYEAAGFMLLDQLQAKEHASRVASKSDYVAAVFADALLPHIAKEAAAVSARLAKGEYAEAARDALAACAATATMEDLERYFQ
jgi:hypothetical protein